jgi:exodeoxyribonuclease VII small subunit
MATRKETEPESARTIEQEIADLQAIVEQLEGDTLGLEESIALYEKGVHLSESVRKRIEEAELKVELLSKRGGKVEPEPFAR